MRSTEPIPGNPWPHDMTLSVDERRQQVMELLWLREAYALDVEGDTPPPLIDTPARAAQSVDDATRARWGKAWPRIWAAVIEDAGRAPDPAAMNRLLTTADGSDERAELLRLLTGASWRDEMGEEGLGDVSQLEWEDRGFRAFAESRPRALSESPERRDLDAVVPAWRKGLTTIVSIPCRGTYTRTLGSHGLLVTEETRSDSAAYRAALGAFDPR